VQLLILARETVLHWTNLYVAAFRAAARVLVAGPGLDAQHLIGEGKGHTTQFLVPNDIVTVEDHLPTLLRQLPAGFQPDAVIVIQSGGVIYRDVARCAVPTVYLSIDTWHDAREFSIARNFDLVFVAQRALAGYFPAAGARRVDWLPLACDPAQHYPVELPPLHDIVFAGTIEFVSNRERRRRIERLAQYFDVGAYRALGGADYCAALARGRLVFNSSIAQDVNMRVFEVMAAGRPLLTNRDAALNGLDVLFEEDTHYIGYDDQDLVARAQEFLGDAARCAGLASRARAEVLERHTYAHRVATVLDAIRALAPPPETSPLREGPALSAYLPLGARVVVDIGLGLDKSRYALRARGVQALHGVGADGATLERRKGSYDSTARWPIAPESLAGADVLLWSHPVRLAGSLEQAVAFAHAALADGAQLILRPDAGHGPGGNSASAAEAWDAWLYEKGFHLILFEDGVEPILVCKRFSKTVYEISEAMYQRFPGGGAERIVPEDSR